MRVSAGGEKRVRADSGNIIVTERNRGTRGPENNNNRLIKAKVGDSFGKELSHQECQILRGG